MRKLFSVIAVLLGGFAMQLQAQSMREAFLKAPEELFPLLTDLCRADLIDYFDAGMTARVTNKLDGVTVLESLESYDNDTLFASLTPISEELGLKTGAVMWCIRIAVSGMSATPGGATEIMEVIGKDESLDRIDKALAKLA